MKNGNGTTRQLRFTVDIVVEPDGDQFFAYAPALKGVHVGGLTEDEALQNALDATVLYLQSLIRHGDPIPLEIVQDIELRNGVEHATAHAHHRRDLALSLT